MDMPGSKVLVAAFLREMRLTVVRVRPRRPAIALCCMPSWASASTSCLIHMGLNEALSEQSELRKKCAIVDSNLSAKTDLGK